MLYQSENLDKKETELLLVGKYFFLVSLVVARVRFTNLETLDTLGSQSFESINQNLCHKFFGNQVLFPLVHEHLRASDSLIGSPMLTEFK